MERQTITRQRILNGTRETFNRQDPRDRRLLQQQQRRFEQKFARTSEIDRLNNIKKTAGVRAPVLISPSAFIQQRLSEGYVRRGNRLIKDFRRGMSNIIKLDSNGNVTSLKIRRGSKGSYYEASYSNGKIQNYNERDRTGSTTGYTKVNFVNNTGERFKSRGTSRKTTNFDFSKGTITQQKRRVSSGPPTTFQSIQAEQKRQNEINSLRNRLKKEIGLGKTTLAISKKISTGEVVVVNSDGEIIVRGKGNKLISKETRPITFKERPLTKEELAVGRNFDAKSIKEFQRIVALRQPKLAKKERLIAIADNNIARRKFAENRRKIAKEKGVLVVTIDKIGRQTMIRTKDLISLGITPAEFISRVKPKDVKNVSRGRIDIPSPKSFKQKALAILNKFGITIRADKLEEIRLNFEEGKKTKPKELAIMLLLVAEGAIATGFAVQKEGTVKRRLAQADIITSGLNVKNARELFKGTATEVEGVIIKNAPFIPLIFTAGGGAAFAARTAIGRQLLVAAAPALSASNILGVVETYRDEGIISTVTQELIEDAALIGGAKASNLKLNKLIAKLEKNKVSIIKADGKKVVREIKTLSPKNQKTIKSFIAKAQKELANTDQRDLAKRLKLKLKVKSRIKTLATERKVIGEKGVTSVKILRTKRAARVALNDLKASLSSLKGTQLRKAKRLILELESAAIILAVKGKKIPKRVISKFKKISTQIVEAKELIKKVPKKAKIKVTRKILTNQQKILNFESKIKTLSIRLKNGGVELTSKTKKSISDKIKQIKTIILGLNKEIKRANFKITQSFLNKIASVETKIKRLENRLKAFPGKVKKVGKDVGVKVKFLGRRMKVTNLKVQQKILNLESKLRTLTTRLKNQIKSIPKNTLNSYNKTIEELKKIIKGLKTEFKVKSFKITQAFMNKVASLQTRVTRLNNLIKAVPSKAVTGANKLSLRFEMLKNEVDFSIASLRAGLISSPARVRALTGKKLKALENQFRLKSQKIQ